MQLVHDPKENNGKNQPITNDPEEVIKKPDDVQESNDEKIDQDYPGYPHYPAKDDILNPENKFERVEVDVEKLTRSHAIGAEHLKAIKGVTSVPIEAMEDEDDIQLTTQTSEADVTAEDLLLLGSRDDNMDMGEDEELKPEDGHPNPQQILIYLMRASKMK